VKSAVHHPIAVSSIVALAIVFGVLAFFRVPIQLSPDIDSPVITIRTDWPGASPNEIEREIIIKQEDALKAVENLVALTSEARPNSARVKMEFAVGTDMERALLLTSNNLDRVSDYPSDTSQPTLSISSSEDNPIAWFRLRKTSENQNAVHQYGTFINDVIKARLERISGVGSVNVFGGSEKQLQIIADPFLLARYGLSVSDIVQALRSADIAVSAGDIDQGKRSYTVRIDNQFDSLEPIENVVLRSLGQSQNLNDQPLTNNSGKSYIHIRDIGKVVFGYNEPSAYIRSNGFDAIALNITRQTGANVIETMQLIKQTVDELNGFELARAQLKLEQVYDETIYINSAIDLVTQNIWIGGVLAILILIIFLRSFSATIVVITAIPVSVVMSFVAMVAFGRSLNVISLAGIAFAVGMVVDATIVVLENIFRLRQNNIPAVQAAEQGAKQVWGAILVSTLTTVMVFVPILFMELEVGQLFRDIAVAISVAVIASMLIALTLIPSLSARLLNNVQPNGFSLSFIDNPVKLVVAKSLHGIEHLCRYKNRAILVFLILLTASIALTWKLLPKLEYLPQGNRNFVFGVIFPPPGYNLETMQKIGDHFDKNLLPLLNPESEAPHKIKDFFFVNTASSAFVGASAQDSNNVKALIPNLQGLLVNEPGVFGFFSQPSIFGRGIGGTRSVDIDISGDNLETIAATAQMLFGRILGVLPPSAGNQVRPRPGLVIGEPEIKITPNNEALFDNGLSIQDYGQMIDTFNDGIRIKEISVGGQLIDLILKGNNTRINNIEGVGAIPIVTQTRNVLPANSFARINVTVGPSQIRRVEGKRTITLQVSPRNDVALEQAMDILRNQVINKTIEEGNIDPSITIRITGTASKLDETWNEMKFELAIALLIVYFIMASLFSSFIYPFIVIMSVPIAACGGVLGLALLNLWTFNPLDMLTMLGFIILIGIVVNNAILIVHQTLHYLRVENFEVLKAIIEATQNRIRPIFMSTLTSVFGMLPLALFPGAGSEIYRGLGSVVIGGLALSALLTLVLVPTLLSVFSHFLEQERNENMPLETKHAKSPSA
ncbi:MAG: efflux RND transporter permease subunit, partial [Pseudomonadota bacterium]